MNILPNISLVSDALGWAVLHSLWQGLVAAVFVFVVRSLTRERASELRYFTGFITLCALLFAFVGTFLYYFNAGAAISSVTADSNMQTLILAMPEVATTSNPLVRLANYTNLIGIIWAVGFLVLGVRYLSAFRLTHKLRTTGLSDIPSNWQTRFTALAAKSGVGGRVRAYFSDHVSSPITFGFFKPIVLLPTWFFTGMTPEQCEAVILHELAHIRRHDYLTNIVQIAIKTVFFYHPAVGFICKTLDADREHACDDFAVMMTKNPESLATALGTIRLKAARDGGVFALSADGRDAPLMGRLKRLMGTAGSRRGTSLRKGTSRGLAATAMMVSAAAIVMTLGTTNSEAHPQKQDTEVLAGKAATGLRVWGDNVENKLTLKGKTYTVTSFDFHTDGKGNVIINGYKYPTKYAYNVFARNGKSYVVKKKNGKLYMEIGGNWYLVDGEHSRQHSKDRQTRRTTPPTPLTPVTPTTALTSPTPLIPTTPPTTNYWVSDQDWQANEDRIERANERREKALERAQKHREATLERTQERREAALERAQATRERAEERRQEAWERAADHREAEIEHKQAHLRQKIDHKKRSLDNMDADHARKIAKLKQKIQDKKTKVKNSKNMSQSEVGRFQGEIGRLQGEIGRLQSARGYDQGKLGRLQGELGQLQGKLGRIQGEWGQKEAALEQKKYYAMRDRLIPQLKADGYMKTDRSKVTIKMTPTDIFINGKQLTNAKESKYCDIVSDYIARKGDMKKIVIKPGYLHVSYKDAKSNSNYSYTHNEN